MPCLPRHVVRHMMRRKPLDHATDRTTSDNANANDNNEAQQHCLSRTLTAADLMLYGVGCSVGAGIYCLVGIGAGIAGPAIAVSFLGCGTACMFTSLAYAEFAARFPVTGSAYVYAYVAFGEFWGWLVGWNLTLGYGFTVSVVARSWAEYVNSFAQSLVRSMHGGKDSALEEALIWLTRWPIPWIAADYTCSPLSIVIIALCTLVLVTGAKESSQFNNFMTVLNISVLLFVVASSVESFSWDNLVPFAPQGLSGIAQGAGLVFYAFIGFDMVACLSEEVVNPEVNMPLGIVGSLVISAAIYVSVSLAVTAMAPVHLLGGDTPLTNALLANACCTHEQQLEPDAPLNCLNSSCRPILHHLLAYGSRFVSFGAIFGLTSGTFTSLMGQPRIFYGMAQDGLLFPIFGKVDPTTHVPTAGIIITGVVTAALACFIDLEALANMISLGTLMVFTFVDAGVIILRWSPSLHVSGDDDDLDENYEPLVTHSNGQQHPVKHEPSWLDPLMHGVVNDVRNNGSKPLLCTLAFTAASLFGAIAVSKSWIFLAWLLVVVAAASAVYLMMLPQSPPPETFSCPGVPVVPMIGIASNAFMMGSLPAPSWALTLTWLCLGVAVYFLYGMRHSKLGKTLQSSVSMPIHHESDPLLLESPSTHHYDSTRTTTNGSHLHVT